VAEVAREPGDLRTPLEGALCERVTKAVAEQAFRAMFLFLDSYWSEFKTATLADVLGDLQPAEEGRSSDPAAWHDWLRAVETATQ
jgi:hypothetical protein